MVKPLRTEILGSMINDSTASAVPDESSVHLCDHNQDLAYERALFAEVAHGNETAFRKLFELYSPLFSYIIYKVTKEESLIPDCLQDTFLKIWLKRDMLTTIAYPRKWAMQIVYHLCFNHLKHKQVQRKHLITSSDDQAPLLRHNAVEKEVFHRETAQALKGIILQLPPQTQKVYRLSREEGMDIQQIADMLQLSSQTVRNTLCRGLKTIRMLLNEKGILVSLLYLLVYMREMLVH